MTNTERRRDHGRQLRRLCRRRKRGDEPGDEHGNHRQHSDKRRRASTSVSGGAVKNQSGGTISGGGQGVFIAGGTNALTNAGDIYGRAASGAVFSGGGTVTNTRQDHRRRPWRRCGRRRRRGDELGRDSGLKSGRRRIPCRRRGDQPERRDDQRRELRRLYRRRERADEYRDELRKHQRHERRGRGPRLGRRGEQPDRRHDQRRPLTASTLAGRPAR